MAATIRVELNRSGIREFLRSDAVRADVERRAQQIAAAAGEGYEASVLYGFDRVSAFVRAESREAREAEARGEGSLLGAIAAGAS